MIAIAALCVMLTGVCVVHHSFLIPTRMTIRISEGDLPGGPVYRFTNAFGLLMMLLGVPLTTLFGLRLLRSLING